MVRKAWTNARIYFGIDKDSSKVLHHKDETLKYKDPKRYNEWRIEDLEVMDACDHISLHHKNKSIFRSKESIEKQKKTITGRKRPDQSSKMSGKNNPMYGKKRPEVGKRNSELKKGKPNPGVAERWRKWREAKGLVDNSENEILRTANNKEV